MAEAEKRRARTAKLADALEVDQPGLRRLRETVANQPVAEPPAAPTLREDALAGLTTAISSVPDGMAAGVLAGVNPLFGLHACIVGPVAGGLLSSTRLMVVTTTSAAALVAGQSLLALPSPGREGLLFLMVVLAGVMQIAFGVARLGWVTRFVSYSVMTGFLAGISVVLVLSQLPQVAGYAGVGTDRVTQTIDLLSRLAEANVAAVSLAATTLVIVFALRRTRLRLFSSLVAIAVPTFVAVFAGLDDVQTVRDVGELPGAVPEPILPAFEDTLAVFTGAFSVAVVVLVQGAGVSQSVPNPGGARSSASRDFVAQGVANVVSGLFRGLPVGASMGTTALNVVSGARRRWAAVFAGVWMAVIVVVLPGVVGRVVMPALGALLLLAGVESLKPSDVAAVWRAGWTPRLTGLTTFVATLYLPIQAAVGLGVTLSALLYLTRASNDISVFQVRKRPDGRLEEHKPPKVLASDSVTVLDVYGYLFYAGVRTLDRLLPRPAPGARRPVVVLRLRGHSIVGATVEDMLAEYAVELGAVGGRLYLSGMKEEAYARLSVSGKLQLHGLVPVYESTPVLGESTERAVADARAWLVERGLGARPWG